MQFYVLNQNFGFDTLVDSFDSLIWTERYSDAGEFELTLPSNSPYKSVLVNGAFVTIDDSLEVAMIDSVSDEDGVLTITGQTLTDILRQRIFRTSWGKEQSQRNHSTGIVAASIVEDSCLTSGLMYTQATLSNGYVNEPINNLVIGNIADGPDYSFPVPYGPVYDAVKAVCDADAVGFKLYPSIINLDGTYQLVFDTYRGLDRTSTQSDNPPVVYEEAVGALTDIKSLKTIAGYKTHAYARGTGSTSPSLIGFWQVSGGGSLVDFKRRTLFVDATDIDLATYGSNADFLAALNQRAKQSLIQNNYVKMFDGTLVPQKKDYIHGIDYNLGDVIELRDSTNVVQKARVTEYIRSQDATGQQGYPTLSV